MGGENVIGTFVAGFKTGSSPRGRGKREGARLRPGSRRLIPAWAGKTARPRPPTSQARAHPRVGGENLIGVAADLSAQGSSPRGRGKHDDLADAGGALRLIPAWAGKTMADRSATSSQPGSSPRGRGKPSRSQIGQSYTGLIPAWAGKTPVDFCPHVIHPAHPRVGGENERGCEWADRLPGSSPRGRGKPTAARQPIARVGLIPAWAGKTTSDASALHAAPAHPRVGGEN